MTAGVELARTGGPNAVVLRAASREAGVSHNAEPVAADSTDAEPVPNP